MNASRKSEKRKPNPILKANLLSKWVFWWTRETFKMGMREQLEADDLYTHIPSLDSKSTSRKLIRHWDRELQREKPSMLRMIFHAYGWKFVPISILYSILDISIHTAQPIFLGNLVSYFAGGQTNVTNPEAYMYATGIVLCSLVAILCFHPFMFYLFDVGTRIRVACSGLVYRKCLRSSVTATNSGMSGFAISVLSTDLPQFNITFYFFHELWKGPLEACVFGYFMYQEIGWPAVVGAVTLVVFIPLQAWAAKAAARYKYKSAEFGDDRVNLMNEIIMAMQVIKMYAWEKSFAKLIAAIRKKEVKAIRGSMNIYAALQCTNMLSKFSLFVSLAAYVISGEEVTARKVFIVSSYFEALNDSLLHFWPLAVTTWVETVVCADRVTTFLIQSEQPPADGVGIEMKQGSLYGRVQNEQAIEKNVILHNVSAGWEKVDAEQVRCLLKDVSFDIRERQFVGIVGNIGAGKTTLLHALLGELKILHGNVEVNGVISFAPQEAWIFEASIRDNIVFVEQYDEQRYKTVLRVCALEHDLELFPRGDLTITGERGISLSGGQKARISLARAVYRRADIYIFDDPLSAVDSHVGKLLLDNCFLKFLGDKIRILTTHTCCLKEVDQLMLMEAGRIVQQGTYEDLKKTVRSHMHLENDVEETRPQFDAAEALPEERNTESLENEDGKNREEQQLQGSVKFQTYLTYLHTLGHPWAIFVIVALFILARVCQGAMDIFTSKWASWEETLPLNHASEVEDLGKRQDMVQIYTILIMCTLTLYIVRTFGFFYICQEISLRLHYSFFDGIIRAGMVFFNTNPSGRILNRCSSDIANIDVALPQAMLDSIEFFVNGIAVLVIVATANYWLLIPAFVVICLLYLCRGLYIGASRSLKRIETMTRSPVYSHTNQTFHGLSTVRAFNATSQLESEFHGHMNNNTSALYLYVSANRAFAFWTDLLCVVYIFVVTFSFLVMNRSFYSGEVGLAITHSMTLIIMCQWGMRQTAEMENNMTSVERIIEYAATPPEPALETDRDVNLSDDWPSRGAINFNDVRLRYTDQGDYVLKGLGFSIQPTEKIGIVGRSGAGKSSIVQAIFRLALNEGRIDIDGCDISTLGLHDLRSRISIIPQVPVLFSGTLRYNLDPFGDKTDEELWRVLEVVKLKFYVMALEGGLNHRMQDGGTNFSQGQRQLVCMARAILRHNQILVMDEPTANVDRETDKLIQETIHNKFEMCTVLTIAHRLHTIMDNDRVLVMEAGRVVESGHPYELLQQPGGHLHRLVERSGSGTAKKLRLIAEQSYRKRVTNKRPSH